MTKVNFHQKAIIRNEEGKFLVLKAAYKKLRWDLPGGGVEIPEHHDDALQREVLEESGVRISNITPLEVQTAYNLDENSYVLFIGYQCDALDSAVKLSSEHSEYKWVNKEEFLTMDATPYLKDFVSKKLD